MRSLRYTIQWVHGFGSFPLLIVGVFALEEDQDQGLAMAL